MFPKGIIAAPTQAERFAWLIKDNAGELVGAAGVVAVLAFLSMMWWMMGRDPRAGPLFPRYDAPAGMSPAAVRFVDNMGFDNKCVAAAVLGLGARGFLKVRQDDDDFVVQQTGRSVDWLAGDKPLVDALFASRTQATLTKKYDPAVAGAQSALSSALRRQYKGVLFRLNSWPMWLAIIGAVLGLTLAAGIGAQPVVLITLVAVLLLSLLVFRRLMPAYTREGRRVQDHIEGLRQYLGVAERDDLARMQSPDDDARRVCTNAALCARTRRRKDLGRSLRRGAGLGSGDRGGRVLLQRRLRHRVFNSGVGSRQFARFARQHRQCGIDSAGLVVGGGGGGGGSSGGGGGGGGGGGW